MTIQIGVILPTYYHLVSFCLLMQNVTKTMGLHKKISLNGRAEIIFVDKGMCSSFGCDKLHDMWLNETTG